MPPRKLYFEAVRVGDDLPAVAKAPIDRVQLARYAGASGDFNPIHVDEAYARGIGMPSVYAPGMLVMGFLGQLVSDWARGAQLRKYNVKFIKMVWPGDTVVCKGRVTDRHGASGRYFADVDLWAENQKGELVMKGQSEIQLFYSLEDENRQRAGQTPIVVEIPRESIHQATQAAAESARTEASGSKKAPAQQARKAVARPKVLSKKPQAKSAGRKVLRGMSAQINRFISDLRELSFVLNEQFRFAEVAGHGPFKDWGPDEAKAVLQECYRYACEVTGPLYASADREGAHLENGHVTTPKGFKDAWSKMYELGVKGVSAKVEFGGQGAPRMLHMLLEDICSGANPAFNMYPGLAFAAGELIEECGTPDQVHRFVRSMFTGKWGGTMCLTEPQAGSDVGSATSQARKQPDGSYKIKGTKMFISGGDHDLAENIIHLVLARVENAPPGTKGLSLFIVPKIRINASGKLGATNDVNVAAIEHKMGINASATCLINFGESDGCVGELVGGIENAGMSQMFKMMNGARIAVGIQGLGTAAPAYLQALQYARERKQGSNYKYWKDPTKPRVAIIEHPDVRRMLIDMKSHVEGIRALIMKLVSHVDRSTLAAGTDDEKAAYHRGQVELLTPLVKAYASDEGFRICATAMQVYGGAGYLKDHPVEQATRDSKIFAIYEGTNHIQAMDLVGRKLNQAGGAHFQQFMADVAGFVEKNREHPVFGKEVQALGAAQEATVQAAMTLLGWSQSEKLHLIGLNANRFLRLMSQLTVGWLLLDAGVIANAAQAKLSPSDPDHAFYEGKKASAVWFARNMVPEVAFQAQLMAADDDSPMKLPDEGFGKT